VPTEGRKMWTKQLQTQHGISIVMSCAVVGIGIGIGMSRAAFYYEPKCVNDSVVMDALERLVERRPRWGFPKCYKRLRALGHGWNHKRVYRIYTEMRLNMRCKSKKRLPPKNPEPLVTSTVPGRSLYKVRSRTFSVIDDFN